MSIKENSGPRMPFGKHKGELIEEIPSGYLQWFVENVDEKSIFNGKSIDNTVIIREVEKELKYRSKYSCHIKE